jgi:hypothetical protein
MERTTKRSMITIINMTMSRGHGRPVPKRLSVGKGKSKGKAADSNVPLSPKGNGKNKGRRTCLCSLTTREIVSEIA